MWTQRDISIYLGRVYIHHNGGKGEGAHQKRFRYLVQVGEIDPFKWGNENPKKYTYNKIKKYK